MPSHPTAATGAAPEIVGGVRIDDPQLADVVSRDLGAVEDLIGERLRTAEAFMSDVALHLFEAGGKRFRPLITVLSGHLFPGYEPRQVVKAGAVCELVHLATLYHDDVMDEADVRRGVESANVRWGNSVAILAGDFLFAHSSMLLAELGAESVQLIADTFAELVTGQMRETVGPQGGDPAEHYLQVIREKTGSLIAAATTFGGMHSGASAEQLEALSRFGDAVGVAFQIVDDLLDIVAPTSDSGKTPGTDLREGVLTLPMLLELERPECPERTRDLLSRPLSDEAEVAEALELLRESEGMRLARARLDDYVARAFAELDALPAGPANDALRNLTLYTTSRLG